MTETKQFLIVGIDSGLGAAIAEVLAGEAASVAGTSRRAGAAWPLDLALPASEWRLPPADVAFLCAGITAQQACAAQPAASHAINVEGLLAVAERLRAQGSHVVYPSSNLVLGGDRPWPAPDAAYRPRTEYARQKAAVEQALMAGGGATVLRIGKVAESLSVLDAWHAELAAGGVVRPFGDVVLSPVGMRAAAAAMAALGRARATGIHHYSASRDVSYADVAEQLRRHLGSGTVEPVTAAEEGWDGEPFPAHTCLDCAGLAAATGIAAPDPLDVVRAEIERRFPA